MFYTAFSYVDKDRKLQTKITNSSSCFGSTPGLFMTMPKDREVSRRILASSYLKLEDLELYLRAFRGAFTEFTFKYGAQIRKVPRPLVRAYAINSVAPGHNKQFQDHIGPGGNVKSYMAITLDPSTLESEAFQLLKFVAKPVSYPGVETVSKIGDMIRHVLAETGNGRIAHALPGMIGQVGGYTWPMMANIGAVYDKKLLADYLKGGDVLFPEWGGRKVAFGEIEVGTARSMSTSPGCFPDLKTKRGGANAITFGSYAKDQYQAATADLKRLIEV